MRRLSLAKRHGIKKSCILLRRLLNFLNNFFVLFIKDFNKENTSLLKSYT